MTLSTYNRFKLKELTPWPASWSAPFTLLDFWFSKARANDMSKNWFKLKELTPWPAWLRHSVLTAALRIACTFENIISEKAADKCWNYRFSSWYSLSQNVKINIGVKDLISSERPIVLCQFSVCLPWQLWRHVFKTCGVILAAHR